MNITELAKKPKLIEILLDDQDIIDNYGESISFWMRDHLDINTYFDFYRFQSESTSESLMRTLRKIILKADGTPALADDDELPIDVLLGILGKVNEVLGKSNPKKSMKEVGKQQD